MSRPFFAKEKIQHFQIFDRHASDAVGQIRDRLTEGAPIDIQVRSSSRVCVILGSAYRAHLVGCCLSVLLGLRDGIPVRHRRSLALCGSQISTRASIQRTGRISSVEFIRGSVPWGPGSRVTEVPLQFLLAAY